MATEANKCNQRSTSPWKTLLPFRCSSTSSTNEIPIHRVGFISFLSYAWLDGLMWKMFRRRQFDVGTVWSCPSTEQAVVNADRLEQLWKAELVKSGPSDASIRRVFIRFVRGRCMAAALLLVLALGLLLFSVAYILLSILTLTVSRLDEDLWKGLVLVAALFLTNILSTLFFLGSNTLGHIAAGRLRAGVLYLLYRKLLQTTSLPDETIGKVINLYTNDGQRIFDGIGMLTNLLAGPLLVVGATAYAIYLLGAWALIGFGILLLLLPLQMFVGKTFMLFRGRAIVITDRRVRLMNEYLANMRFIKLYSWEKPLSKLLAAVRDSERRLLERVNISLSLAVMSPAILASIATMITLVAYTSSGNHLTGLEGFMYLLIYSSIQDKLEFTMLAMKMVSEMFVAAARFQAVFSLDEVNQSSATQERYLKTEQGFNAVEAIEVQLSWPFKRHSDKETKPSTSSMKNGDKQHIKRAPAKNGDNNNRNELTSMLSDVNGVAATEAPPMSSLTFKITKGSVVGVAGPVSSGKTALIKAVLGQMNITSGQMTVTGSIAYVPQQPWIFNATVRENIVLGSDFDKARYDAVLAACCLERDLEALPDGDATVIGERGVTLSGGQRQRISLARAAYSRRDILLMDDPFSSIDPDVSATVFRRLVLDTLLGSTIILATHQIKFLTECDHVIYLPGGGREVESGTHEELIKFNGAYSSFVSRDSLQQQNQKRGQQHVEHRTLERFKDIGGDSDSTKNANEVNGGSLALLSTSKLSLRNKKDNSVDDVEKIIQDLACERDSLVGETDGGDGQQTALASSAASLSGRVDGADRKVSKHTRGRQSSVGVVGNESEQLEGLVSHRTYAMYIGAAGGLLAVIGVVFASLVAEGVRAFSYWWLAYWLEQGSGNTTVIDGNRTAISDSIADNPQLWVYDLVYGMSLVGIVTFFTVRCVILAKVLMRASSRLHDRLFQRVMGAPVSFFDTTPLGRIINRFSRDMDEMDTRLPMLIDNTIRSLLNILIYLGLISAIMPWFLVVLPVAAVAFILLYAVFRVGIRRLQRRQLASMSPLLAHVDATVRGLSSIHAYGQTEIFKQRFSRILDENTVCVMLCYYASRWVNVHLSLITTTLLSVTALLVFLLRHVIPTAYAGAAIIYAFQLLTLFQFFVRFAVDTEATFTSTERIRTYNAKLPQEGSLRPPTFGLPSNWPADGRIEFSKFMLRYSSSSPLVLNDITFAVKPKEKVGIVGRTGAGKTSLVSAMFRLTEKCGGAISIDGIDISLLELHDVRSALSIIPQDPVLFSGTIRSNLDPFERHIDQELWRALEKCHIKDVVSSLDGQLSCRVSENGDNFSQGERQLLCMARVMLRHTRIVVLDEATASLDPDMAKCIQDTVRETFADCTMLIIAHSMKTIMHCDRVLVLDAGKVVEFDEPAVLLSDSTSMFSRLVASSDFTDDSCLTDNDRDSSRRSELLHKVSV